MNIRTLVIDCEKIARDRLINLIEEVDELELIGQSYTGKEAISTINKLKPDVIFLDTQMKDIDGFDVIQRIEVKRPLVIFVTANNECAPRAFDYFAFDFLLKPFKDDRFFKSVENIINYYNTKNYYPIENNINNLLKNVMHYNKSSLTYCEKIPVKLGNKIFFINSKSIKYIAASGSYSEIYTKEKTHLLRESLSNLIESLNPEIFIRIHRSTIVNLTEIRELAISNPGEVDVIMEDRKIFKVSKTYKKRFLIKMGLKTQKYISH